MKPPKELNMWSGGKAYKRWAAGTLRETRQKPGEGMHPLAAQRI